MRILVADDDPVYRMLMARELSKCGHDVECVCDGAAALASLSSQNGPSLATLDWRMPGLDGLEVCRRVRANSEGRYVYLILVTANNAPADLLAGLDAGADDYLTKPLNMAELQMRVRAGCRILEFEARSRHLFEDAPTAYYEANPDGVIVRVNQAGCKLLGYAAHELLGRRVWDFVGSAQSETSVSAFLAAIGNRDRPIEDSEWELYHRNGNALLVRLQQNQVTDSFGRVVGLRCTMQDVTELRRQSELLKSQAADLERSNAELEQFAYVASHDLREPLRMVDSFAQLLSRRYAGRLDSTADKYIGFMLDGAKRMQQLISDLLSLSRVGTQPGEFGEFDLDGVLSEVLLNLGPAIHDAGAAVTHGPLSSVVGNRGQVVQLLQNLIGNAMKFQGAVSPLVHVSSAKTEQEWTISVSDNGIGIAPAHADRIFQIFQRLHTRDQYPGTGIGLAICRKIVERHGGRIWFDSAPGAGTTFHFTLPRRAKPQELREEVTNAIGHTL